MAPVLLEETYAGNTGVPVVEGGEFINNVDQSRNIRLSVVVHNLLGSNVGSQGGIADEMLFNKAFERGQQRAISNSGIAWAEAAVELQIVAGYGVIRVIEDGVEVLSAGTPVGEAGVGQILGVTIGPVVDGVVEAGSRDTTEDIVEGTVLQDDPDNILDLRLKVLDGRGRAGLVAKGGGVDLAKGRAGCGLNRPCHGGKGQEDEESSRRLHTGLEYRRKRWIFLDIHAPSRNCFLFILRLSRCFM